jgi:simple sugar transport system permease protein
MRLERRTTVPPLALAVAPVGAVAFTLLVSSLLVLWAGAPVAPPGRAAARRLRLGVRLDRDADARHAPDPHRPRGGVAFRARLFNIGGEGQLYAGALAAVGVGGLHGGSGFALRPALLLPLMMLARRSPAHCCCSAPRC